MLSGGSASGVRKGPVVSKAIIEALSDPAALSGSELRIQIRRDSTANWGSENPVLYEGELGVDLSSKKIKLGDGATAWADLPFMASTPAEVSAEIAAALTVYTPTSGLAAVAFTGSASSLIAGTLADIRLSSNVPLKNAASNAFTGAATFGDTVTAQAAANIRIAASRTGTGPSSLSLGAFTSSPAFEWDGGDLRWLWQGSTEAARLFSNGNFRVAGMVQIGGASGPLLKDLSGAIQAKNSSDTAFTRIDAYEYRVGAFSYSRVAQLGNSGDWGGGYNFNYNSGVANRDSTGPVGGVVYGTSGVVWYAEPSGAAGTISPRMSLSPTKLDIEGNLDVGSITTNGIATIFSGTSTNVSVLSLLKWGNREGFIGQTTGILCLGVSGGLGTYTDSTLQTAAAIQINDAKAVSLFGTLGVTGAATFNTTLGVAGAATIGGTLQIGGASANLLRWNGPVGMEVRNSANSLYGNFRCGNLQVSNDTGGSAVTPGNVRIGLMTQLGAYLVGAITGRSYSNNFAYGDVIIGASPIIGLGTTDYSNIGDDLVIRGNTGNVEINRGNLTVVGQGTFGGTVQIGGASGPRLKNISGTVQLRNFTDTSNAPLDSGSVTISGTASISSNLSVTGSATVNGSISTPSSAVALNYLIGGASGPRLLASGAFVIVRNNANTDYHPFIGNLWTGNAAFGSVATPANTRLSFGTASGTNLAGSIMGRAYASNLPYGDVVISANPVVSVTDYSNLTDDLVVRGNTGNVEINRGRLVLNDTVNPSSWSIRTVYSDTLGQLDFFNASNVASLKLTQSGVLTVNGGLGVGASPGVNKFQVHSPTSGSSIVFTTSLVSIRANTDASPHLRLSRTGISEWYLNHSSGGMLELALSANLANPDFTLAQGGVFIANGQVKIGNTAGVRLKNSTGLLEVRNDGDNGGASVSATGYYARSGGFYLRDGSTGIDHWRWYKDNGDNNAYFRDVINNRNQVTFIPGVNSSSNGTHFHSRVLVDDAFIVSGGAGVVFSGATPVVYGASAPWMMYSANSANTLYLRDITNGRMHVTYVQGASSAAATTTFHCRLIADDVVQIGGSGGPRLKNSSGVIVGRNSADSAYAEFFATGYSCVSSGIQFRDFTTEIEHWRFYKNNSDPTLYVRDMINARMHLQLSAGASAATALTHIRSALTVDGATSLASSLSVNGNASFSAAMQGYSSLDFYNSTNYTRVVRTNDGRLTIYRPNDVASPAVSFGGGNDEIQVRGGLGIIAHSGANFSVNASASGGTLTLASPSSNVFISAGGADPVIAMTGRVTVSSNLQVSGTTIVASAPPATSSSTGTAGTVTWDSDHLYVCTATNTWKRAPLASW